MEIEVWGQTDVGLKREINQDSILVDQKLGLYIVADGMGGHKGGEVASALAVETVRETVETQLSNKEKVTPRDLIVQSYREASARIYNKSTLEEPDLMGMGTTMVLAFSSGNRMFFGNVGDSRAYLFRDNHLWQLTEDHSLVSEQVRAGIISEDDAEFMAGRNVITRSVGFEKDVEVDVLERDMHAGEMVLLCSDGLCGLISDEQIVEILKKNTGTDIVNKCVEAAKSAGGDDNISVIVLKVK